MKGLVWSRGGGGTSAKPFSIFYMLNSKNRGFNRYLSNEKNTFADNSRIEPTIFFMEKTIVFFETFFSGHFYGQYFIKTVRGPFQQEQDRMHSDSGTSVI